MSRTLRSAALGVAFALVALSPAGAQEVPVTTVDSLEAEVSGSNVLVSGEATFTAPAVEVALDAAGDHFGGQAPAPTGTDLTSGTIRSASPNIVEFELVIANLSPVGTPEAINYNWPFNVVKGGSTTEFQVQAHSQATGREIICSTGLFVCTGSVDNIGQPIFDLQTCAVNPDTGQNQCASQPVPGEMTETSFIWRVPTSMISASGGATIVPNGSIAASRSASGITWWTDGSQGDTMIMGNEFIHAAPTVSLGIAPAGTPDEEIELTTTGTASPGGSFNGSLPAPGTAGEYTVVAEACLGAADSCGTASVPVTV